MSTKGIHDLKNKSADELRKLLLVKREELRVLKFDLASGKVKNVSLIQNTKRNIARILTLLRSLDMKKPQA